MESKHLAPKNPEVSGFSASSHQHYVLTDGSKVFDSSLMTPAEAAEANRTAGEATDGNVYWALDRSTSSPPPADLAGLRAWKASRTPSTIIKARRAAQALAASRMAAKVAQDKLEARISAKVAPRELAQDILHHIRTDDKTPEQGVSDYELEGELAQEVTGIIYDIDAGGA